MGPAPADCAGHEASSTCWSLTCGSAPLRRLARPRGATARCHRAVPPRGATPAAPPTQRHPRSASSAVLTCRRRRPATPRTRQRGVLRPLLDYRSPGGTRSRSDSDLEVLARRLCPPPQPPLRRPVEATPALYRAGAAVESADREDTRSATRTVPSVVGDLSVPLAGGPPCCRRRLHLPSASLVLQQQDSDMGRRWGGGGVALPEDPAGFASLHRDVSNRQ